MKNNKFVEKMAILLLNEGVKPEDLADESYSTQGLIGHGRIIDKQERSAKMVFSLKHGITLVWRNKTWWEVADLLISHKK